MGVPSWSLSTLLNASVDPLVRALDGASSRSFPEMIRGVMAGVRALSDDRGGAITTGGTANAYTAKTASGVVRLEPGTAILVRIDRANTDLAFLNVDGTGPRPWCDRDGTQLGAGLLGQGRFLQVIWDANAGVWVSDVFSGLTLSLFDGLMRSWRLSLPDHADGIGPNAPWRDGDMIRWTAADNPTFALDSPEGRRTTLRLIKSALPTSSDGLAAGEPWLSGGSIAFVPDATA